MIKPLLVRRQSHKAPQQADIPVWPLWLIVITAFLIALAVAARLDDGILAVTHFPL